MQLPSDALTTPVYLKTQSDQDWPDEPVFYLLTADGLFLCRNHAFFRSSVPAPGWPAELEWHNASLRLQYPKIPRWQIEQVVAFFADVGGRYQAEAIVLLGWNQQLNQVEIIVPEQVATVGRNRWGDTWPIGVDYQQPADLPRHVTLFGDIHSHVDGTAYASHIDRLDEAHRAGLHIVLGRIFDEPPDFFAQAVVDGTRFDVKPKQVLKGYRCRAESFPQEWLERVQIKWPSGQLQAVHPDSATSVSSRSAESAEPAERQRNLPAESKPNDIGVRGAQATEAAHEQSSFGAQPPGHALQDISNDDPRTSK